MKSASFYRLAMLSFGISAANAQTQISPKYSVDAPVNALASRGDTLIVGGDFNNVGVYTGGGALFTTSSDQPNLAFPKIIGSIRASTPDAAGGFYVYGYFRKESEPTAVNGYKRIEHIRADHSFDTGFSIPVNVLFEVERLLYHNGLLYIGGGYINTVNGQPAGDLAAIDVTTKQLASWLPAVTHTNLGGVNNLYISQNTLYIMGGFSDVGGQARQNIAAIELYSGIVKPWNFAANFADPKSYNDIKSYNNKVVIGGNFGTTGLPTNHACALVDTVTGTTVDYVFASGGLFGNGLNYLYFAAGVSSLAINGDTLFAYSNGTFDTRITAIDLAAANHVLWARYFNIIANARNMAVKDGYLYVAGTDFVDMYLKDSTNDNPAYIERQVKNMIKLNAANGSFVNWLPDPVGNIVRHVLTMSISGNNIFGGGSFSHVNGLQRTGILMLRNSTQQVLPFNVNVGGHSVRDFKIVDSTLYAAGTYTYLNGAYQPRSVLSFNINSGAMLSWNPGYLGTVNSVEANRNYIFLGGSLVEPQGGSGRVNLFGYDRPSGNLLPWAPNPDQQVNALHISRGKLYVGGGFSNIGAAARSFVASFDTTGLPVTSWNPQPNGQVNAIESIAGTILIGGSFSQVNGVNCNIFAGLSSQNGSLKHSPITNFTGGAVNDILVKGCYAILGGAFRLNNTDTCNALALYDVFSKSMLPASSFCQNIDDLGGTVNDLAATGSDLYFGGSFTKVNARANASNIERVRFAAGYFTGCLEYISLQPGNWHLPATWESGAVPPNNAQVRVRHLINVAASANCFSLDVEQGGQVTVSSGAELRVEN